METHNKQKRQSKAQPVQTRIGGQNDTGALKAAMVTPLARVKGHDAARSFSLQDNRTDSASASDVVKRYST